MSARALGIALVATVAAAFIAAGGWYHANRLLGESRSQVGLATLVPIAGLLKANQALVKDLQAVPFAEPDTTILAAYLGKIRRDGVAKNVQMKQRLDQLSENNTAIVTLIKAYAPHAKTSTFTTEADKFRNYAAAWRDRWNSVMELFMAGGNYVASEVPFPKAFPEAVRAEIAAAK